MSYQALYRTWRPRKFARLIGQDHIVRTLINALSRDRLAHAYLFCGPRGTGKTSAAKILARAVNCEDLQGGEPCGKCSACAEIIAGRSMDVLEIDAASNRGIDEIRELREKARFAPARLRHKVYIIDEVHMLTPEAFNALLKTLEEPPSRVLFILATTEPYRLPATILSRCQRFDFYPLEIKDIVPHLAEIVQEEGYIASEAALLSLARFAAGGMRDALSLLEQALAYGEQKELTEKDVLRVLGQAETDSFLSLAEHLAASDVLACLEVIENVTQAGKDLNQFAKDLLKFFRDLTLAREAAEDSRLLAGFSPEMRSSMQQKALLFSRETLLEITDEIAKIISDMKWAEQPRLLLEVGVFRLCHLPSRLTLRELISRIGFLEEKVALLEKTPTCAESIDKKPEQQVLSETSVTREERLVKPLPQKVGNEKREGERGTESEKWEVGRPSGKGLRVSTKRECRERVRAKQEAAKNQQRAVEFSVEELQKAWERVLKIAQKEKPFVYNLLKDSFVYEVHNNTLGIAFPKNSEFAVGMLKRRQEDSVYMELLLEKVLLRKVSLKYLLVSFVDSDLPAKAVKEEVAQPEELWRELIPPPLSPLEVSAFPERKTPGGNIAARRDSASRKPIDNVAKEGEEDFLLESAREIFKGKIIE